MRSAQFAFSEARSEDFEDLLALRIEAMRESLARLGRYSPERARARFESGFDPACTRHVLVAGQSAGFVVVKQTDTGRLLDHLYIRPSQQRLGLGSAVVAAVLADADAAHAAVSVWALKQSAANRFYLRHGFEPHSESEWDVQYLRKAR